MGAETSTVVMIVVVIIVVMALVGGIVYYCVSSSKGKQTKEPDSEPNVPLLQTKEPEPVEEQEPHMDDFQIESPMDGFVWFLVPMIGCAMTLQVPY